MVWIFDFFGLGGLFFEKNWVDCLVCVCGFGLYCVMCCVSFCNSVCGLLGVGRVWEREEDVDGGGEAILFIERCWLCRYFISLVCVCETL